MFLAVGESLIQPRDGDRSEIEQRERRENSDHHRQGDNGKAENITEGDGEDWVTEGDCKKHLLRFSARGVGGEVGRQNSLCHFIWCDALVKKELSAFTQVGLAEIAAIGVCLSSILRISQQFVCVICVTIVTELLQWVLWPPSSGKSLQATLATTSTPKINTQTNIDN